MLVYVALVGIVSAFLYSAILSIYFSNQRLMGAVRVNSNAYSVMERIRYEIENADSIYLPTSNMVNYNYNAIKASQLSLVTKIGAVSPEEITFVDFYLENETIFLKKEGLNPIALTSSDISVSNFNLSYYENDWRESVTINLSIQSNENSASTPAINLTSTIALRS